MSVIQPLEDAHWAKLAQVPIETSITVGSDRFTQEIQQLITPSAGLRTQDSRATLLQQAGVFADDPTLTQIRHTTYENRGRSETELTEGVIDPNP
jgi:hypothetical protein